MTRKHVLALFGAILTFASALADEVPLTPSLVSEIIKDPYVSESVQSTNSNPVGVFTQIAYDRSGKPVLGILQAYDNVTRSKMYLAIPWDLFRYDQQSRRIQVQAAADQLRRAPTYPHDQIARLADGPEMQKIRQHFSPAAGGGAVGASMGTQTGQGSSAIPLPATNDAQPKRGSVGVMYVTAALVVIALILGFVVRRRT